MSEDKKDAVWYSIVEDNHMSRLFCEMDEPTINNFKFVMDNLYLGYTKEQVLNFIAGLYDNADNIFNKK